MFWWTLSKQRRRFCEYTDANDIIISLAGLGFNKVYPGCRFIENDDDQFNYTLVWLIKYPRVNGFSSEYKYEKNAEGFLKLFLVRNQDHVR